MTTQPGITVDLRQFNQAIAEYAAATKRDLPYSLNRAGKNICYRAIGEVRMADKTVFAKLSKYAPLVGWKIEQLKKQGRLPRFNAKRSRQIARNNLTAGAAPIDQYQEYAEKMILARRGRAGFVRGFFLRMAKELEKSVPGGGMKAGAKRVDEIQPTVRVATPQNLTLDFGSLYRFKKNSESGRPQNSAKVESMLNAALQPAIDKQVADMTKHVESIINKNAKRISVSY